MSVKTFVIAEITVSLLLSIAAIILFAKANFLYLLTSLACIWVMAFLGFFIGVDKIYQKKKTLKLSLPPYYPYQKKGVNRMSAAIKKLWNNPFYSSLIFLIAALVIFFAMNPNLFSSRFIVSLLIGAPILILLLLGGLVIAASMLIGKKDTEKKITFFGENGIIRIVPANHVWIVRKWNATPGQKIKDAQGNTITYQGEPVGYKVKREGLNIYIPIYYIDEGFVDIAPKPRDPDIITVNTKDNQNANIDWRIETFVSNPVYYVIRVRTDERRIEFEDKRATALINQRCAKETQEKLTSFSDDELKKMGTIDVMPLFNEDVKFLGIQANALDVKKIIPPQEVIDAAEYITVSQKREKAAAAKGREMKALIDATQADGTKVMIADIIRGAVVDLANAFIPQSKKKEK